MNMQHQLYLCPACGVEDSRETIEIHMANEHGTPSLQAKLILGTPEGEEVRELQRQVARLRLENEELVQERRAARSEAAAGNNNINSDFPFKQQNKAFYEKIIASAIDLLEPCLDNEDIPWACATSKHIFEMCHDHTQKRIMDPQQDLKTKMLVSEGGEEVPEWENTRVSIVKLQRATRTRMLRQLTDDMEGFGGFRTWLERPVLAKLLSHSAYKKKSLETFVKKLAQVSLVPECTSTPPREHTNIKLIVCVVLTGSDGGRPR